jgi:uroporphyrinogen-III decarboxylase
MHDGGALGRVLAGAAKRYCTPLAIPLMDLRLEKADVLRLLGLEESLVDSFHFKEAPSEQDVHRIRELRDAPFACRNQAHIESVRYIATQTQLKPLGMAIGPFSLMTKLVADPITAVAMAGAGVTAAEDGSVLMIERCLALAEAAVTRSVAAQARAGAKAVLICEPAANRVYLSPKQIGSGSGIFEQYVMQPNLRIKQQLEDARVDLIFHDCGELTVYMVEQFATRLDPVILSLGSSRRLWEDAAAVPKHVVLYGNLPTKNFFSDDAVPLDAVPMMARDLIGRMRTAGHPHILGSECDVLHVPEASETIRRKVEAMLAA